MSDMSHVYKAYAAVHNSEKRNDLSEVRDEISEMNLKQLTDVDLYEVAEEVLEDVFAAGADIADAKKLIESVFTKASEGDANPFREDKIDRLAEAFISAFEKVTERSLRTAVESYSEYRVNKERLEKWNDSNSTGNVNAKLHEKLVAQDRLIVKTGLLSMIESLGSAVDKALGAVGDTAKEVGKAAQGTVNVGSKVAKKVGKAAGRVVGTPIGVAKSIKKGFQAGTASEGYESPAAKEEKLRKSDKLFGSPNNKKRRNIKTGRLEIPKEAYTATPESGTGKYYKEGKPTAQQLAQREKREKIKSLTNQGKHKEASALHNEDVELVDKLVESGKFSGVEIARIADIQEADIADIIARLEKKRISKGGDPKESPLPAMRNYHADKKKK